MLKREMVTKTKPTITIPKEKKDWVTPLVVAGGAAAVGVGLYLFMKKPPGVSPGGKVRAHFSFDYMGEGGIYIIQVSFGTLYPLNIFDHIEGMTWDMKVELPAPDTYEFDLDCKIPSAAKAKKYDAEALIRTPEMGIFDYLIKIYTKSAIEVRGE